MSSATPTSPGPSGTRTDLTHRLGLRRKQRRRAQARLVAWIAVAVAFAVALGWLIGFSHVLETREVSVEGNEITSTQEVLDTAQVPMGVPMARLDVEAIRQRVLSLVAVADVKVTRSWPNTVSIAVTERTLVFQRVADGVYQWVDTDGRVFNTSPERVAGIIATTTGDDPSMLGDVATVVGALPADVAAGTDHVEADTIDHIVVFLADGRQIVWGNADKSSEKAALLPTLMGMEATVIDVSVPSHPAIR
ncbi:FtsQ-type POTRA domain-containing protein [Brooklawnia cerclae]|uniref:Cell division protein FtsQ n=1 Tax=Brooklawnia cerclae TaxID=349934 RepID=A0ABX0SHS7_9ACTN|nr:FtsQ-type POTRA domain-containing protein [Brooklawnia cerclae]NIH57511.1 cell division protein FtsQ [Brooklawnia cerclae]